MPETASGSCLCGAVRFTVELPTLYCAHCHCSMCRRNHGAAFVTWFGVGSDQLTIDAGADRLTRHRSSEHGTRSFCSRCGSSLFCDHSDQPGRVNIVLAVMQTPIGRDPDVHTFFDARVPWVSVGDDLPRLGGETGLEPLPDDAGVAAANRTSPATSS
jgi:hypothetical protein